MGVEDKARRAVMHEQKRRRLRKQARIEDRWLEEERQEEAHICEDFEEMLREFFGGEDNG